MQKTFFCTVFVLVGVFFLFAPVQAATNVSGTIAVPTTWSASGSPYVVNGNLGVSSTLTIEPGVVVKLGTANAIFITANGTLNASGVTFTSSYDDAHGGIINGQASSQSPSVSNGWGSINNGGNLSIQNSNFFYGGRGGVAMIEVIGGNAVIENNQFKHANNAYIQSSGTASVKDNVFEDIEQFAVWQKQGTIVFGANTFTNIARESYLLTTDTFTNEGNNAGERTLNLQNMVFTTSKTLSEDGLPYQFNSAKVNAGVTLTLNAGSVVKFWHSTNSIINDGTLKTLGTKEKPVVLTSYEDDAVGGDSNGNGAATVAQSGQWGRIYNNVPGVIDFTHTTLRYGGVIGLSETGLIINHGTLTAKNSIFSDSRTKLINSVRGLVNIEKSELARAQEGIVSSAQDTVAIHSSDLLATENQRILNASSGSAVDASNNYWGNASGPTINGNPSLGPTVSTNVNTNPYLTASSICRQDCFSNVLFLPGIMGSRLYEQNGSNEDELWFSSLDNRHERMEMNSDGTSKNDVYTKENSLGIVDETYGSNLYKSFLADLGTWKAEGVFNNYSVTPYDWRLSLEDVVMNGKVENGKLKYTSENTDLTQSYLYQQAKALQQNSKSEKITLIGHSNGGLVIKAFIQKLKETNDPLYDQIDKVIFVGVPQTGTPDSVVSLLYGSKIGILWIGTSAKRARFLAHDMPTMYNLLPSEKLFNQLDAPIEFVGDNVPLEWTSRYGNKINTYEEFEDFLTGEEGRDRPEYTDLYNPEVLSESLFNQAQDIHQALDNWAPSANTEVIQIAGWGLYTVAGLQVVDDKECKFDPQQLVDNRPVCYEKKPTTTLRDRQIFDGDATVLAKSALDMPEGNKVKKYWVDLFRYNDDNELPVITERKHKSLLEVDTLLPFVRSIFQNNIQDTESDYITASAPPPLTASYLKYKIHSPLNLTVIDGGGNKVGWDSNLGRIVENVKGAQYSEIGEIKTLLIPKDTEHTVQLEAYEQGSFTLDITELNGEETVSETKFEAIPTLENTIVEVDPSRSNESASMAVDFTGDGTVETELVAQTGEEVEYQNPQEPEEEDITPPEITVTFDQDAKDVVWRANDTQDPNPTLEITSTKVIATDGAGNTTEIPFTKYRESKTRLKLQFADIIYNEEYTDSKGKRHKRSRAFRTDQVVLIYDWQLKKDALTDLDTTLRVKDESRIHAEYRKITNKTRITEKDKKGKIQKTTTKQGFVSVKVSTSNKNIIWEY